MTFYLPKIRVSLNLGDLGHRLKEGKALKASRVGGEPISRLINVLPKFGAKIDIYIYIYIYIYKFFFGDTRKKIVLHFSSTFKKSQITE